MAVTLAEYSVKSLLGPALELSGLTPVTFKPAMDCTLNAKYNVYPAVRPTELPKIMFFGIGIGGKYNVTDTNRSAPFNPSMLEMDLYTPIPFRCLPEDEDALLTASERAMYRMRVLKMINGQKYYAYYLKKLEFTDAVNFMHVDPVSHAETPYTLDPTNLTPTGKLPSTSGVTDSTLSEVICSVEALATITGAEVIESINALYGGDLSYGVISEMGVYSGVDSQVKAINSSGKEFSYLESIYTQMITKYTWLGEAATSPTYVISKKVTLTSGTTMTLSA